MIEFVDKSVKVPNAVKAKWTAETKKWRLPYWHFARLAIHCRTYPDSHPLLLKIHVRVLQRGRSRPQTAPTSRTTLNPRMNRCL